MTATSALAAAARIGPYVAWADRSGETGWRPWTDLLDETVAAERVEAARAALVSMFGLAEDDVPLRVVASVTFLGYAARVVSPLLGAAVTGGAVPAPAPSQLWWRPVPGGPLPIAYAGSRALATGDDLAEALIQVAVDGLLAPLLTVFEQRFVLSPQVLWGNVASALAGAAGMIADAVPEHAGHAGDVVSRMLGIGPLAGTGTLVRPDPERPRRFLVRDNCCLYYRIPGGGTCGDCVLTPAEDRRRHWQSVLSR